MTPDKGYAPWMSDYWRSSHVARGSMSPSCRATTRGAEGGADAGGGRVGNLAIHPPVDDAEALLAAADRVRIELPFSPRSEESEEEDSAA